MFIGLYVGAKHTAKQTILKHFKNQREADKAYKQLVKDGLIIEHPTSYGMQISLNKNRIAEIKGIIFND